MKVYAVGGSIRNQLLGLPVKDRDYVVVGATEQQMLSLGFKKVGADFPVFLDAKGEEYALARAERSTGPGYNDFEVRFGPEVTLEQDLMRRDLTINSMAQDLSTGAIVDPFGGRDDIERRVLRMTHETAFAEDPVRVLRLARFCAEYPAFCVDSRTREVARTVTIESCTAERVALEMTKALKAAKPSRFFEFLSDTRLLSHWFKEVADLQGKSQPIRHHMEGDAFVHTMMVTDAAARAGEKLEVVFACLAHDFGKGTTSPELLPSHHGHEERGVELVAAFCSRLKLESALQRVGQRAARYHTHVHNFKELKPKTIVRIFEDMRSHISDAVIVGKVAFFDNEGKLPYIPYADNHLQFAKRLMELQFVKLSAQYKPDEIAAMSIEKRKETLHRLRISQIKRHDDATGAPFRPAAAR